MQKIAIVFSLTLFANLLTAQNIEFGIYSFSVQLVLDANDGGSAGYNTQLLLSGIYHSGANNGSEEGTLRLKSEGCNIVSVDDLK